MQGKGDGPRCAPEILWGGVEDDGHSLIHRSRTGKGDGEDAAGKISLVPFPSLGADEDMIAMRCT